MDEKEIEKSFIEYINCHGGIMSALGKLEFTSSNRIGQGGNGLVYLAKINKKEIAIKFLISDSKRKINRFKSEYFNVNYIRNELKNIVNMIYYGELKIKEGVQNTLDLFLKKLEKHGVALIKDEKEFDPNLHEAMFHVDSENHQSGEVVQVLQKGYKIADRVIRPTKVSVAK